MRPPGPAIIDERQALAFRILEIERQPAVALDDVAVLAAMPAEARLSRHQSRVAAPATRRPVPD